jgi:hypothetical protein
MAQNPFLIAGSTVLAANGAGTFSYTIPEGESYRFKEWRFTSTGAFTITGIRDSNGQFYSNASQAVGILSTHLQSPASANIGIQGFMSPLELKGSVQLLIDYLDTSGAGNTVRLTMTAERVTQGG